MIRCAFRWCSTYQYTLSWKHIRWTNLQLKKKIVSVLSQYSICYDLSKEKKHLTLLFGTYLQFNFRDGCNNVDLIVNMNLNGSTMGKKITFSCRRFSDICVVSWWLYQSNHIASEYSFYLRMDWIFTFHVVNKKNRIKDLQMIIPIIP